MTPHTPAQRRAIEIIEGAERIEAKLSVEQINALVTRGLKMDADRTDAENTDPDEFIDQDDSRYDGFRIRELWMATTIGPDDQEGVLGLEPREAREFHLLPGPAFAADGRRLRHLKAFAQKQADTFGVQVTIRHFVVAPDDGEVIRGT